MNSSDCTKLALLAESVAYAFNAKLFAVEALLVPSVLYVPYYPSVLFEVTLNAPNAFKRIDDIDKVANSLS